MPVNFAEALTFLQEFGLAHAALGKKALGSYEPDVEDLRILLGELRPHLAEEGQLAFVVKKQIVTHRGHPSPGTRRW